MKKKCITELTLKPIMVPRLHKNNWKLMRLSWTNRRNCKRHEVFCIESRNVYLNSSNYITWFLSGVMHDLPMLDFFPILLALPKNAFHLIPKRLQLKLYEAIFTPSAWVVKQCIGRQNWNETSNWANELNDYRSLRDNRNLLGLIIHSAVFGQAGFFTCRPSNQLWHLFAAWRSYVKPNKM